MNTYTKYQVINVTEDNPPVNLWAVINTINNSIISYHANKAYAIAAIKRYRADDARGRKMRD